MSMQVKTLLYVIWLYVSTILTHPDSVSLNVVCQNSESFDLLISGGKIIDGTGSPVTEADLLIKDDEIVYIGPVDANNINVSRVVDATGKIISPGFIDSHAHGNPMSNNSFENFLAMGVTTIVLGQDGSSPVPDGKGLTMEGWMDRVTQRGMELNIAMFAGHGSLRTVASIPYSSLATEAQVEKMCLLLSEAFESGIFGMSTGLEYIPGLYARDRELLALAKVVGQHGGMIMSHLRSEDDEKIDAAMDELIRQGQFCPVHISHIKVVYGKGETRAKTIIEKMDSARYAGIRISADVYPYNASYTGISIVFPDWAKTTDQLEQAVTIRRQDLLDFLYNKVEKRNGPDATLFTTGDYQGKTLAEVARDEKRPYPEVLLGLGPQGASGAYFVMDEVLQDQFIAHPDIMICSDGSPTMRHPRGYGTFAKIIERYVNESGLLSLPEAIRKMTSLPAGTIGISKRGRIAVGFKADILVFEPERVKSRADYTNPFQFAEGFDLVIVNGMAVRENGKMVNRTAGRMLKNFDE